MVWDLGSGRRSYHFELGGSAILSPKTVHSLEFSADSNVLFSADSDCSIKIWDVKSNIENVHQDGDHNGIEK
jgi:WD40 repeat protein